MAVLAQVIKYEGDNQTFIWKHPVEDFNSGSQLIVHESQEAVFFMDGQVLDSFGPGRHTLETQNIPLVSRMFNRVSGDQTPFHCELYFINKTEQMGIKWGTNSKLEYIEPTFGFPIQLGASGEMNFRIEDGRKLLLKVVGTESSFTQTDLLSRFRAFLVTRLKPYMVTLIRENKINIFQIDEFLESMSAALQILLQQDFLAYGLSLEKFFITNILKPEDDKNYRRFKEIHFRQYADVAEAKLRQQVGIIDQQTAAQKMIIEAKGMAEKRAIEGYTYQQERSFDVAERVAGNQGVGEFSNMGIGMGMISGIGGTLGNAVGGMMSATVNQTIGQGDPAPVIKCAGCGTLLSPEAKFCPECGAKNIAAGNGKMICPQCKTEVVKGKFCENCGAALVCKCSACGKEVVPGAKFCLECGTALK